MDDIYKSHLWYFNLLTFLIEHELPTESCDNIGCPTIATSLQMDNVESVQPLNMSVEGDHEVRNT